MELESMVLALITGGVLPFITTYLSKALWPEVVKFVVVVVIAGVVGFIQTWASGNLPGLTMENAVAILGVTYVASSGVFWLLVDNTRLRAWLESHGVK